MNRPYINSSENMLHSDELFRLKQQSDLLRKYDEDIYFNAFSKVFEKKTPNILDIGSGSGYFFFSRLDDYLKTGRCDYKYLGVDINLEKYKEVVQGYEKRENVCFVECDIDVTGDSLPGIITEKMDNMGIEKFDLINMSWVALHLNNIDNLLKVLKGVLSETGIIMIEDIDDRVNAVSDKDSEKDFNKIYDICDKEGFSGNRKSGLNVKCYLEKNGYIIIDGNDSGFSSDTPGTEKKDFWDTYFEMIYQDMKIIRDDKLFEEKYTGVGDFENDYDWLMSNRQRLYDIFHSNEFTFVFGVVIYVASLKR